MKVTKAELERDFLRSVLIDNAELLSIGTLINDNDFVDDKNALIFVAMRGMAREKEPIDPISLCERINKVEGALERCGGVHYICSLLDDLDEVQI